MVGRREGRDSGLATHDEGHKSLPQTLPAQNVASGPNKRGPLTVCDRQLGPGRVRVPDIKTESRRKRRG
eukprot:5057115-Amphidinium_carterae.1